MHLPTESITTCCFRSGCFANSRSHFLLDVYQQVILGNLVTLSPFYISDIDLLAKSFLWAYEALESFKQINKQTL